MEEQKVNAVMIAKSEGSAASRRIRKSSGLCHKNERATSRSVAKIQNSPKASVNEWKLMRIELSLGSAPLITRGATYVL